MAKLILVYKFRSKSKRIILHRRRRAICSRGGGEKRDFVISLIFFPGIAEKNIIRAFYELFFFIEKIAFQ